MSSSQSPRSRNHHMSILQIMKQCQVWMKWKCVLMTTKAQLMSTLVHTNHQLHIQIVQKTWKLKKSQLRTVLTVSQLHSIYYHLVIKYTPLLFLSITITWQFVLFHRTTTSLTYSADENLMETNIDTLKNICGFDTDFLKHHMYCTVCNNTTVY